MKYPFLGKPEYEIMQTAWRERNPGARIKAAKEAIGLNPECATAYILLAEEEVPADILYVQIIPTTFLQWGHIDKTSQLLGKNRYLLPNVNFHFN